MENNFNSCDEKILNVTNNHVVKNKKNSLRLKLIRVFNSGTSKNPKSSKSVSNSPNSSPDYNISCRKMRYSWHSSSAWHSSKECHKLCSFESDILLSSSKSIVNTSSTISPITSFSSQTIYSTWYNNGR